MNGNIKPLISIAAITGVLICSALYIEKQNFSFFPSPKPDNPPTQFSEHTTKERELSSQSTLSDDSSEQVTSSVDFQAIRERFGTAYDPMIILGHGEFSDEEVDAYNDLHVIPFNPVVGVDCKEVLSPTIPNTFDKVCDYRRARPSHPFTYLSDEELAQLAKNDAVAAVLMARRVIDSKERFDWYMHAAALSGKPGPIMSLAERRFSDMVIRTVNEDGERVNLPDVEQLISRSALEKLALAMGDPRGQPERFTKQLSDTQNEEVKALTRILKEKINQIRLNAGLPPVEGFENV